MKNYLLLKYLSSFLKGCFLFFFTATILLFTFFTKSFSEENVFTINNVTVKGKIDLNFSREKYINKAFLEPNQIIRNAGKLKGIPGTIVHGRYDMVCPVNQAFALSEAWPEAQFDVIADAGHSSSEVGTVDALIRATERLAFDLANEEG